MDGIQPFPSGASRTPAPQAHANAHGVATLPPKQVSDYARALRRRVWLVLAVAVPLSVGAAVMIVRMPSVYRATAQIQIEAPEFDPILTTLVSREVGRHDSASKETYVPTKLAQLKSKPLVEQVLSSPEFAQGGGDQTQEIIDNLQTRPITGSSSFLVTLEGTDPARTAKVLYALLERFREQVRAETARMSDNSLKYADENLTRLKGELAKLNEQMARTEAESNIIGPGGKNMLEQQFDNRRLSLEHKLARQNELRQQILMYQILPPTRDRESPLREGRLAELKREQKKLESKLRKYMGKARSRADAAVRWVADQLQEVLDEIEELQAEPEGEVESPHLALFRNLHETTDREVAREQEALAADLRKIKESTPEYQAYQNARDERILKLHRIAELQTKIQEFQILEKSQRDAVEIPDSVAEPSAPIRPKRALMIVAGLLFSFGLAIGLVCTLEHFDHSVKVPEHLSAGLTLPLLGVVPRIRRTALIHRGGHLWTPGAPDSVEADAYRNLRASLLGATDRLGEIVTLLVTSAKAGEGKSTTALNLAATCARAGERTLLIDVDLRRPSLGDVFDREGPEFGLVDVLRGELPWQRTLVRTGLPNLDFMPTGDTRDIPIEILGTLELRQLLAAVAGHYDRVILDGPAVLGLADCRMLGRVVDAALLVVRSGSHGIAPVLRAKTMLEQSRVTLAGVVFNGLYEDLQNWSSYGPYEPYGSGYIGSGRPSGRLGAPSEEHAALAGASYHD